MRRTALGLAAVAAVVVGFTAGPASADPPGPPSLDTARAELTALTVATPHSMDGYSRDAFDVWAGQPDGCTTRQDVLSRDGKDVVEGSDGCQPSSGSWYSVYDDTTVTVVAQATIDHMVPLAEAWRSGADKWTADQRKAFGNDLKDQQLFIASSSSNSSKGDSGPADWKPTNKAFWCTYGEDYTHIKSVFKLTTTDTEKTALTSMLNTCTS
ncbi:HNH endonuclease family protein (plasmid) [Streptomyces sp. NBC_00440]|uniref:GmrSD restriction endonuclease domain-containing protein n=1 Tax=unclassified Streptomyces TaxID=2593676 RepID=UPI002E1B2590|nr:HNH endonuclease family protein [Streptomyces sp. NBC_00963]